MQNKLEKPKFKHNKKRNTAFLFESLVKELTKSVVYGEKQKQKVISTIIKEHFKKNSILEKELSLYKQIYETKQFPKNVADKLLTQIKAEHEKLNEQDIFNEQSRLIAKINKFVGAQVYNNFVPNYKTLATISQIFSKSVETKQKVLLEQELSDVITGEAPQKKVVLERIDSLTLNRFVDRFNEEYNGKLLAEQKNLLNKFINYSDDDLDLKVYVNEEIDRLKSVLSETSSKQPDNEIKNKLTLVTKSLNSMKVDNINEDLIKKIMYIQEFAAEVQK